MSWLDDADDDEPEFDEADVRVRPNPKANRPRTKRRPAHADARIARVLGVAVGQVNVKAKTAEKLGPVGQGLSIEARAVALLIAAP